MKGDYIKDINKRNPLGTGGRIATAYAHFLNEIYSGDFSILAPRTLKQTVSVYAPQFNNNYQHDSQEFCQYLFDGLHEDLNRVQEKPYVEEVEAFGMKDSKAAMESWKKHLLRHDSIFVDYTQGMVRLDDPPLFRCHNFGRYFFDTHKLLPSSYQIHHYPALVSLASKSLNLSKVWKGIDKV